MKQLSNLTKIMFCIVSVLLVITVALGIATAVKDGKENKDNQGQSTTVTPIPDLTGGAAGTPGATQTPDGTETPDATPTPDATETPTPTPTPANKHVVAIDPGQQKSEMKEQEPIGPGAEKTTQKMSYGATSVSTPDKKREYEWTLLFSKELRAELEARGYEVIMTREENDVKISNAERAQKISETNAEIYVSIQADAASKETAHGIYAQVPTRDNPYVKTLYNSSKKLAKAIQTRLITETGAYDRSVREDDSLPALNYSKIPATVLTLGFMTNNEEDTKLWTAEYRQKMIKAICDGIDEYFGE